MSDWSLPTNSTSYLDVLDDIAGRLVDAVKMCSTEFTSPTNLPTGAIRWNNTLFKFQKWDGSAWNDLVLSIAGGGTGGSSAGAARTALGLGSMATQDNSAVNITGGTIGSSVTLDATSITAGILALARGGLGVSLSIGANGTLLLSNGTSLSFVAGTSIPALSASSLTTGTVPDARFPSTLPALSGVNLTALNASNLGSGTVPLARLPQMWPIGSIFIAVVSTNPNTLFGYGTWAAFGTGRCIIGIDTGQTEFNTIEKTGGAKTHTHSVPGLSIPGLSIPALSFTATGTLTAGGYKSIYQSNDDFAGNGSPVFVSGSTDPGTTGTDTTGGDTTGSPSNGLPPYITVYMWKRTA